MFNNQHTQWRSQNRVVAMAGPAAMVRPYGTPFAYGNHVSELRREKKRKKKKRKEQRPVRPWPYRFEGGKMASLGF